jgi:hypothetical protein
MGPMDAATRDSARKEAATELPGTCAWQQNCLAIGCGFSFVVTESGGAMDDKRIEEMTTEELTVFAEEHIGCYELADLEDGTRAVRELRLRALLARKED